PYRGHLLGVICGNFARQSHGRLARKKSAHVTVAPPFSVHAHLHGGGKRVESRSGTREYRVSENGSILGNRHFLRIKNRATRWTWICGLVSVPGDSGIGHADEASVLLHIGDDQNLRMVGQAGLLVYVEFDPAEALGKGYLLLDSNLLIPEKDHTKFTEGVLDAPESLVV